MRFFWLFLVALGLGTKRHWHILFAILFGISLGLLFSGPEFYILQEFFGVVGQIFIRLITMIVIPLVVSSLVVGVSALGDSRQLGRMGGKVLFWFVLLMLLASVIGGGLSWLFQPGLQLREMLVDHPDTMFNTIFHSEEVTREVEALRTHPPNLRDLFFNMIPQNPIESLAKMELVPVIVFTLLFGVAIAFIGDAGRPLVALAESVFTATMKLTDWVMILAVPGIFSLTFMTVSQGGPEVFIKLAPYALVILSGLIIQVFIVFPVMLRVWAKVDFLRLYQAISEAIMVAFGTASSSATLPVTIACCERRAGISSRIASFVLPTGATINKTGTTMFEVIAVIFLAQAYGIPLEMPTVLLILLFSMVASIGASGVPSAGLITIAIVFNSIGQNFSLTALTPGLAMLWSIDRALDMCRTVVNVISSCTVATLVASSEGELNRDILNNRESWMEVV